MQMDICSRIGFSPNDINRLHRIRLDTLGSTDISVDELAYGATKFLNIQDDDDDQKGVFQIKNEFGDQKGVFQMKNEFGDQKGVFQMKNECGEGNESEIMTAESFIKCGIFPCSRKTLSSVGGEGACKGKMKNDVNRKVLAHDDDDDDDANLPCSSAPSLPKLVSAMKGSREKGGKKLNVKWAPDVYDPVPTSVVVSSSRNKHKNSKKKSKKKGSSRESKGKEKKQSRKRGSSLNYYYNSEQKDEVTFVSAIDFHLHLDHFCGSSFANPYGSNLHLSSIAEAI